MTDGFLGLATVEGDTSERDALIDQFNLISWASKSVIDIFSKTENFISTGSTTARIFNNKLRVPANASNNAGYIYLTNDLTLVSGSNITKICFVADFDTIPTGATLKIEFSTNTNWTTVYDATGTTVTTDLLGDELTSGFDAAGNMQIRITLSTNGSGEGPTLNNYAVFTDPEPS